MDRLTFKFENANLNRKLLGVVQAIDLSYQLSDSGEVVIDSEDAVLFDEVQSLVRTTVFCDWSVCERPGDELNFENKLKRLGVSYAREFSNGQLQFLVEKSENDLFED